MHRKAHTRRTILCSFNIINHVKNILHKEREGVFNNYKKSVISLGEVPSNRIYKYGIVKVNQFNQTLKVNKLIGKPNGSELFKTYNNWKIWINNLISLRKYVGQMEFNCKV